MNVEQAHELARSLLEDPLPRRWAHSQGVAAAASALLSVLELDGETLVQAAVLHDIGYSPAINTTGFHPLDGARHLREQGQTDDLVVRLVANHSFALLEAEERGLRGELESEFPLPEQAGLVDALVYCDMTTTPDGARTTSGERISEILSRYGADSVVGRFIRRAEPGIRAAVGRVEERVARHR
ncbi:HD domain-containing protein [Streptomyces longispororuber]|uniref:HD domain-containing protein n=1 Tax=Streptomyces longispororuber TaxID=68230 RepID=UPI0037012EBD